MAIAVVVVPGFIATNASTTLLRRFLGRRTTQPTSWHRGRNRGALDQFNTFIDDVDRLAHDAGAAVGLVGWSLGGIASRWVGHNTARFGSPDHHAGFTVPSGPPRDVVLAGVPGGRWGDPGRLHPRRARTLTATPAMPTTSIVSRDDTIAPPASGYQPRPRSARRSRSPAATCPGPQSDRLAHRRRPPGPTRRRLAPLHRSLTNPSDSAAAGGADAGEELTGAFFGRIGQQAIRRT